MRMTAFLIPFLAACCALAQVNTSPPQWEITNGPLRVKLYLPDATRGFYRGTRFDWSGVVADLAYKGHHYYGPWFTGTDPAVTDFIYRGQDIIAGPCSAITGPVEEFNPALGYDEAKPGGTFLKIGVGVLRRTDDQPYSPYHLFPIVNGGKWTVDKSAEAVEFTQELEDPASGYGYLYRKKLSLVHGEPLMVIEHSLRNTGTRAIHSNVYDHNFLVLDQQATSDAFSISFPFKVTADPPPDKAMAEIEGSKIVYRKTLVGEDRVTFKIEGFGKTADDYRIHMEDGHAGVTITGNRALAKMSFWSIRSVIAVEPFLDLSIEPGSTSTWTYKYEYSTVAQTGK